MRLLKYNKFLEKRNINENFSRKTREVNDNFNFSRDFSRQSNFSQDLMLNENLDKSKKFLRDRFKLYKAAEELKLINGDLTRKIERGDIKTLTLNHFTEEQQKELKYKMRSIKIDDRAIKQIEKDPEFLKIRTLLDKNLGYLYPFVYMYYVEGVSLEEIESLYNGVLEYKSLMSEFKSITGKKFDVNFIDPTIPNQKVNKTNTEILSDALDELKNYRNLKKVLDTLPTSMKRKYKNSSKMIKDGLLDIANRFQEIPDNLMSNDKDHMGKLLTKKEAIWRGFFGGLIKDNRLFLQNNQKNPNYGQYVYRSRIKRFENMPDSFKKLIDSANDYLNGVIDEHTSFLNKLDECNKKYGSSGAHIIYDNSNIIILDVKTYVANNFLHKGSTNHCIASSESMWNSYLGKYNKQYYIYNFNDDVSGADSIIGVTIQKDGSMRAAHSKYDASVSNNLKSLLRNWTSKYKTQNLFDFLKPMSPEEVAIIERREKAEIEIVKPNISLSKIKEYVMELGVNINISEGIVLINAAESGDLEKVKFCLEMGADPNLKKGTTSAINRAKNIEIIEELVKYGSEITEGIFDKILKDRKLEKFLKLGLDPNFNLNTPLRKTTKYKDVESVLLLQKYGGNVTSRGILFLLIKDEDLDLFEPVIYNIERKSKLKFIIERLNKSKNKTETHIRIINNLERKLNE